MLECIAVISIMINIVLLVLFVCAHIDVKSYTDMYNSSNSMVENYQDKIVPDLRKQITSLNDKLNAIIGIVNKETK